MTISTEHPPQPADPRARGARGPSGAPLGLTPVAVRLSEAPLRYAIRADDVAAIAFLPAIDRAPEGEPTRLGAGWAALCAGAKGAPPASFDDPEALGGWLREGRHVGALAIVAPTLYLDDDGAPAAVRWANLDPRLGAGFLGGEHNVASPIDRARHEVERAEGAVRVVCWQRFGLGSPLDLRGRYGGARPLGWIRVSYDLDRDGKTSAHLACSHLPSVWFYREGMRVLRVDARDRNPAEIAAALRPTIERPSGTTHRRLDGVSYRQPLSAIGGAP